MSIDKKVFETILNNEVVPALGCTEPVDFALTAAVARDHAPGKVKSIKVWASGNTAIGIQAVGIPNSGGKHGAFLSSALGYVGGDPALDMKVLDKITPEDVKAAEELVANGICSLEVDEDGSPEALYLKTTLETDAHTATVIIEGAHGKITYIEADGNVILNERVKETQMLDENHFGVDFSTFTLESIYEYCKTFDPAELPVIKEAVRVNCILSQDGLDTPYGIEVARTIRENIQKGYLADNETSNILLWVSAGLDARMGGSPYPAMISGGSGNQGVIATMGPWAAAKYRGDSEEDMLRAVTMSHLVNLLLHYHTRDLAYYPPMCYCSAIAPVSAVCGVAFLHGDTLQQINDIICASLENQPGIICDGAKASCAMRGYNGTSASLQIMQIIERGLKLPECDGIVGQTAESSIDNLYNLQKTCMEKKFDEFVWNLKKAQKTIC